MRKLSKEDKHEFGTFKIELLAELEINFCAITEGNLVQVKFIHFNYKDNHQ